MQGARHRCHLCTSERVSALIDFGRHPIVHHLLRDPDQDAFVYPVVLGFCEDCGLTQLIDPIPAEKLYSDYSWLTSAKWNPHVPGLLARIGTLAGLNGASTVLEAGCNDGAFLAELKARGYGKLHGIEPAADAVAKARERGLAVERGYFSPAAARAFLDAYGSCDLFISRQVLEHVTSLPDFADALHSVLRPGAHVLVEVPDFAFSRDTLDYGALWEEHCNYFTLDTITRFLAMAGVEVTHSEMAVFSGQALVVFGRHTGKRDKAPRTPGAETRDKAHAFRDRWPRFRDALRRYITEHRDGGRPVAAYGAGCRAACLINYAGLGDCLDFVVDDQSEKQHRYLPGSRLEVRASSALAQQRAALCLLGVNAENEDKVIGRNAAFLAAGGKFVSIHPPSPRLPAFWSHV